jgi:hypothetical protein
VALPIGGVTGSAVSARKIFGAAEEIVVGAHFYFEAKCPADGVREATLAGLGISIGGSTGGSNRSASVGWAAPDFSFRPVAYTACRKFESSHRGRKSLRCRRLRRSSLPSK